MEVLPDEPVTPTTCSPVRDRSVRDSSVTTCRANAPSAASTAAPEPSVSPVSATDRSCAVPDGGAGTSTAGASTSRAASTPTAPPSLTAVAA